MEIQSKLTAIPHLKSSLFLILRAIISDVLTGLLFDHYRNDKEIIIALNDVHNHEFLKASDYVFKESETFYSKSTSVIQEKYLQELKEHFPNHFEGNSNKIKSKNELISKHKEKEYFKHLTTNDKAKYEFLRDINKDSPLHNLKAHYIYLTMRTYSQYQHFSKKADVFVRPINIQETKDYLRNIFYLMLSIEQISSNLPEASSQNIEALRKLVQANGKSIANIINT
jgi:ribosomal protein S21